MYVLLFAKYPSSPPVFDLDLVPHTSTRVELNPQGPVTILLSSRDRPPKTSSGSATPTQADEMRQKQREIADAKAKKREAAEAKVREKELVKKQKEEEWRRRNRDGHTGPSSPTTKSNDQAGDNKTAASESPLRTEETMKQMEKLDLHSTSTST